IVAPAMGAPRLPPLVLMSQPRRASTAERWVIAGLWVAIFGGCVTMLFLLFGGRFDMDPDALAQTLTPLPEKLRDDPALAVPLSLPFITAAHIWFSRRRAELERVFLDETGIRYQSPLPEALRFLQPSWSLQWSQVRELRVAVLGATYQHLTPF